MRFIARRLGISLGWVSAICSGDGEIRLDETGAWCELLGLDAAGARYFDALVRQASAPTAVLRSHARLEAKAIRALAAATLGEDEADLIPLVMSVHAQVLLELDRVGVPARVDTFVPPISPEVLEQAAVAWSVASGRLGLTTPTRVDDPRMAAGVRELHRDALTNALRALDEDPPETYQFGSLVVALPAEALPEIEERVRLALLSALEPWADSTSVDRVFQLSVQLVARTTPLDRSP